MSGNVTLAVLIGFLFATGVYLVLERSLTRVLLGTVLMGNGANLLILMAGGAAGGPPLVGVTAEEDMSDPLPQAMILTAIVITLGMTAFLLAMAFRSWQLERHDEVQDDVEDRRVARLAALRGDDIDVGPGDVPDPDAPEMVGLAKHEHFARVETEAEREERNLHDRANDEEGHL
ncbi:MAG TPA: Na(+)/H(+) antiporter subunit C [Actinomycetales bacterium]|nr:Na(+)/H(+) antiporter subunit C [Actinomycetales bacterium]